MSTIQDIESGIKIGGVVIVVGAAITGGILLWQFFKNPLENADKGLKTLHDDFTAPIGKAIDDATGGLVDTELSTFGTAGTAQDTFEQQQKLDDNPGSRTLLAAASYFGGVGLGVSVVNGVTHKISQGKDKSFDTTNNRLDRRLKKIQKWIDEGKEPPTVDIPWQYMNGAQKEENAEISKRKADEAIKKHPKLKSSRGRLILALQTYHALKDLQLTGLFLSETDKLAVKVNQNTFVRAYLKINYPKMIVVINKKKKAHVEAFLKNRRL